MKPPRSILSPTFRYVDSQHTNLRKTFARVREEMRKQKELDDKVVPIKKEERK